MCYVLITSPLPCNPVTYFPLWHLMPLNKIKTDALRIDETHQDAKQLLSMSNTQLLQTSSLSILDDLATQAQDAYTGQFDPSTGQSNGGALWIYGNLQRLATFDVRLFAASSP